MAKLKSESGQVQLLLSIAFLALAATTALAINSSINSSITGGVIDINTTRTSEQVAIIEVFANTSLSLELLNTTHLKSTLLLDNGTALKNQIIELYINATLIGSKTTDTSGEALFELPPDTQTVKATFTGNSSLYLNPSEAEMSVESPAEEPQQPPSADTLTVQTDKETYLPGENISASGSLTVNGSPTDTNLNISITLNNTNVFSAQLPVVNGSFSALIPGFQPTGTYTLTASYGNLTASTSFTVQNISVKIPSYLGISTNNPQPAIGDTIVITATLSGNFSLSNRTIDFHLNDIYLNSSQTDENGLSYLNLTPNETGNQSISAIFSGTDEISGSNTSILIEVSNASQVYTLLIDYSEPVQLESVAIVEGAESYPVSFLQTITITNPYNFTIHNQTVNPTFPENVFNINTPSLFIEEINPNQSLTFNTTFSTPLQFSTSELFAETYQKTADITASLTVSNISVTVSIPPLESALLLQNSEDVSDTYSFIFNNTSASFYIPLLTNSLSFKIIGNLSLISEIVLTQGEAEINKPVPWFFRAKFSDFPNISYTLPLPEDAYSIAVKYKDRIISVEKEINLGELEPAPEPPSKLKRFTQTSDETGDKTILAEFFTPAPLTGETLTASGTKRIRVYSNATVHYTNVKSYTDLPNLPSVPRFYRIVNETVNVTSQPANQSLNVTTLSEPATVEKRIEINSDPLYNVTFLDTDGNGRYDKVEWTVPQLSEDVYEIEIRILNVKSYPMVGSFWTVMFETGGLADLIIMPVFGTTFAEKSADSPPTSDDLDFHSLKTGDKDVDYYYLVKPGDMDKLEE